MDNENDAIVVKKKRIYYLDFIKSISIILVIFVHYPWISSSPASNISMCLTIIAVPLFFMVNGALMFSKELDIKKHINKTIVILISCATWKILILSICLIAKKVSINNYNLIDILLYCLTSKNLNGVPAEHLWFLYALIKIYIIFPFVYIAMQKNRKYLIWILIYCIIFSFGIDFLNNMSKYLNTTFGIIKVNFNVFKDTYNIIGNNTQYLTFFIFGFLLHNKFYNTKLSVKDSILIFFGIVFGFCFIIFTRYIQTGNFVTGKYIRIDNDYGNIGNLTLCISLFIFFSKVTFKNRLFNKCINFIGSRTINIYYIHMLVLLFISNIHKYFIRFNGAKLNFARTIIVLIICIAITEFMKLIKTVKKILNLY